MRVKTPVKPSPIISIVDDDPSVRRALNRLIRSAGFEAETFASASEFLECRHPAAFACLILDVRLPTMNGLDLQSVLLDQGFTLPIIFITAHEDETVRTKALERGAVAFLQKPFDDGALLDAVRSILDRKS